MEAHFHLRSECPAFALEVLNKLPANLTERVDEENLVNIYLAKPIEFEKVSSQRLQQLTGQQPMGQHTGHDRHYLDIGKVVPQGDVRMLFRTIRQHLLHRNINPAEKNGPTLYLYFVFSLLNAALTNGY